MTAPTATSRTALITFAAALGAILAVAALALPLLYQGGLRHGAGPIGLAGNVVLSALVLAISYGLLVRWRGLPADEVGLWWTPGVAGRTALGIALGAVGVGVIMALDAAAGGVSLRSGQHGPAGEVVIATLAFAASAVFQQAAIQTMALSLRLHYGLAVGALVPSIVFTALHYGSASTLLSSLNVLLFGVLSVLLFELSGRIRRDYGLCVGVHTGWNCAFALIFGTVLSGERSPWHLVIVRQHGELWSGGSWGPEGSLAATIVLLIPITLAAAWLARRASLGPLPRNVTGLPQNA